MNKINPIAQKLSALRGKKKHSGFIINVGAATSKDVRELIGIVTREVEESSGIKLEPEVRIIDAEPKPEGV